MIETITVPELEAIVEKVPVTEWTARDEAILRRYYADFARRRHVSALARHLGKDLKQVYNKAALMGLMGGD